MPDLKSVFLVAHLTGPSSFWVDSCLQGSVAIGGSLGVGVMVRIVRLGFEILQCSLQLLHPPVCSDWFA
jgi:hypothetical protein